MPVSASILRGLLTLPTVSARALRLLAKTLALFYFLTTSCDILAQSDSAAVKGDTLPKKQDTGFVKKIQDLGRKEIDNSLSKFQRSRLLLNQERSLSEIQKTSQKLKSFLKNGIDTSGIDADLDKIEKWYTIAEDGVFTNTGTAQTHRNLEVTGLVLKELISKTQNWKAALDDYQRQLLDFRDNIDSLASDSSLYLFADDSVKMIKYLKKLQAVAADLNPSDSLLDKNLDRVAELQTRVNLILTHLTGSIDQVHAFSKDLYEDTGNREFANIWGRVGFSRPFSQIVKYSMKKGELALGFYISEHIWLILLLLLAMIMATVFIKSLKNQVAQNGLLSDDLTGQLVLRYPALSAIMLVLSVMQFIFPTPPFFFSAAFWLGGAVSLAIIFRGYITRFWMTFWVLMIVLFFFASLDNIILQASRTERWIVFSLSLAGTLVGAYFLAYGRKKDIKERAILYFIAFVIILESVALVTNAFGRYNLAKKLMISGYGNVIVAILFLWTVRLINEGLRLASQVYNGVSSKLFYINFNKVGTKAPRILYVFLVAGWFILFARNFYAFRLVAEPLHDFLFHERVVGEYTFTIKSILVFFLILIVSTFISRVVSFFATDGHADQSSSQPAGRAGPGSWLLLIRIGIISLGLFFAFAAAGIPMDRVTIIIGALGVGIGFGLQALVNNLVSGLIIAFEKPVNVGDVVEVGKNAGTMKSIGFRSSVITTWDGADVIIPNGDILNEHLINWTRGSSTRRVALEVGVSYGTDLTLAEKVLREVMSANEKILTFPEPGVDFMQFNNSSIDCRVTFWVEHYREWLATRTEVIRDIHVAFKKHDITIPFPQQDVHFYMSDTGRPDGDFTKKNTGDKRPG